MTIASRLSRSTKVVWDGVRLKNGADTTNPDKGWQSITFQNGWTSWDGGVNWNVGEYLVTPDGFVHLRGLIKSPSSAPPLGQIAANGLPAPLKYHFFTCAANAGNYVNWYVDPSGQLSLQGYSGTPPANGYFSISGITYPIF